MKAAVMRGRVIDRQGELCGEEGAGSLPRAASHHSFKQPRLLPLLRKRLACVLRSVVCFPLISHRSPANIVSQRRSHHAGLLAMTLFLCSALSGLAQAASGSVTYQYDELGRLKSTTYNDNTATTYTLDAAGNRKQVATALPPGVVVLILPSVPSGLSGMGTKPTLVTLSWTAATDTGGPGLAGYKIYRGGTQIGTSATPSYSDTTAVAQTTYSYTVAAYDNANNASSPSSAVSVTTPANAPVCSTLVYTSSIAGSAIGGTITTAISWCKSQGCSTATTSSNGDGTFKIFCQ